MDLTKKFIRALTKRSEVSTGNGGFYKFFRSEFTILHLDQKLHLGVEFRVDVNGGVQKNVVVYETSSFLSGRVYSLEEFSKLFSLSLNTLEKEIDPIIHELKHTQEELEVYSNLLKQFTKSYNSFMGIT